jgi:diguanylate cyclase (GGDEF)-like protein/PAS domain S-box-containing protein
MGSTLRVLQVEDVDSDASLVVRTLGRAGFDVQARRVDTATGLRDALGAGHWDVLLCDYQLPELDAPAALRILQSTGLDLPFIVLSGTIGEETAVEMMRAGAQDYLLKDRLSRLAPAIEREVAEARLRAAHREAQRHLQDGRETLDGLIQAAMDGIIAADGDERIVVFNPAAGRIFGYAPQEVLGQPLGMLLPERLRAAHRGHLQRFTADGVTSRMMGSLGAVWGLRKDGREFPLEVSISRGGPERAPRFTAILRDITERVAAQRRISGLYRSATLMSEINALIVRVRRPEELYRAACSIAREAGAFVDAWIGLVDARDGALAFAEHVGTTPSGAAATFARLPEALRDGRELHDRLVRRRRPVVCALPGPDAGGGIPSVAWLPLVVGRDTIAVLVLEAPAGHAFDEAEMKMMKELSGDLSFALAHLSQQRRLRQLAYYDPLTGLANRALLQERLAQSLRAARPAGGRVALAVLAIERFKSINDAAGRHAGDEVLREVAERLLASGVERASLARIGADHFAVLFASAPADREVAQRVAAKCDAVNAQPFSTDGGVLPVSVKAGIAFFPDDADDAESLFQHAEAAAKKAKRGTDRVVFYDRQMTAAVSERLQLEGQLAHALRHEEFVLHYQPKIHLASGRIVGVEALIRWQHPDGRLVPPVQFIPLLEETGRIIEVGGWAMCRAGADFQRWRSLGYEAPRIAVNVSAVQLRERDFVDQVGRALRPDDGEHGLDLEITESCLMDDVETAIVKLRILRALGVRVAIDDFGSGYSSLAYLARLPVSTLKIDRSFIATMFDDPNHMSVVSTVVSLAHSLEMRVVAEGVETLQAARTLRRLGCDEAQGYFYGRPMPFDDLTLRLPRAHRD